MSDPQRLWPPPAEQFMETPQVVSLADLRLEAARILAAGNGVFDDGESRMAVAAVRAALNSLARRVVAMPGPGGP